MNIIVFDLEWNQPTVGKKSAPDLPGEIIQIGAAKISTACELLDTFSLIVRPVIYKKMSRYVAKLTLLSDADLAEGVPLAEAMDRFRAWCGEDALLLSWGPDDLFILEKNLRKFELPDSWLPPCADAQLMFADLEMDEDRQYPLNYALFHFEEKPDGSHNALADVLSTVLVLKHLPLAEALEDEYFRLERRVAEA